MDLLEDEPLDSEIAAEQTKTDLPEARDETLDDLPEKYRGKSLGDIVHMHQEAEKTISRQGQEVGEVRKLADELIRQNLEPKKPVAEEPELDFFEDPKKAVQKAIESSPAVIQAGQYAEQARRMQASAQLAASHPDYQDVAHSNGFIDWVNKSPVRVRMAQVADQTFDSSIANELMSTYKELNATKVRPPTSEAVKSNLKAVQVDTGGTGESSKKIYRRTDLMRLKIKDPARYDSLSDEIYKAYSEGRVK